MKLDVERRTLKLARPFAAAYGTLREREVLIVTLTGADGVAGYGEAAPLEPYDGVPLERALAALERYAPVLEDERGRNGAQLVDACRAVDDLPQAFAAIDIALWDRAGRRLGRPVADLLSDAPAPSVPVNATVSAPDRAGAVEQAARAAHDGFGCLKVKVGIGDDAARLAAIRAAVGPRVALRLDANGAWSVGQAIAAIESLAAVGLELVEEPTHGLHAIRHVRERVTARVAIDESAAEPGALASGVADAVCLKVSRCGGIAGLLAAATLVRACGAEPYVASTLDGPLGVAAAVHAAAALASRGPVPHCGLATLALFEGLDDPLPVLAGEIVVPEGAGLGVEPF